MLQLLLKFLLPTGHFGAEPRGPPISGIFEEARNASFAISVPLVSRPFWGRA